MLAYGQKPLDLVNDRRKLQLWRVTLVVLQHSQFHRCTYLRGVNRVQGTLEGQDSVLNETNTRGQVLKLSEQDAPARYPDFVVASLGL